VGGDTATLTTDVIRRAHALWQQAGPQGHNVQWMQAHGLDGIMGFNQWQAIGRQSDSDLDRWGAQYRRDAGTMNPTDPTQKAWVEFTTQLDRAAKQIEAVFITGASPLLPALETFSKSIEKMIANFFGNASIEQHIKNLGKALEGFGTYLGSDKFIDDVKKFADGISYAVDKVENILRILGIMAPTAAQQAMQGLPSAFKSGEDTIGGLTFRQTIGLDPKPAGYDMDFGPLEQKVGLPPGVLRGLAITESGMTPHPSDRFAAGELHRGMFQMSDTMLGRYGIQNPYDADQESKAAAIEESAYLQRFNGNIAAAIAAWNEGPGAVESQMEKARRQGGNWLDYAGKGVQKYVNDVAGRMNISVQVLNQTGAAVAVLLNGARQ
jgi:hypothetical protein